MNYTHNVFNYSKEDLEDTLDKCKLVVLGALVDEGLLEEPYFQKFF